MKKNKIVTVCLASFVVCTITISMLDYYHQFYASSSIVSNAQVSSVEIPSVEVPSSEVSSSEISSSEVSSSEISSSEVSSSEISSSEVSSSEVSSSELPMAEAPSTSVSSAARSSSAVSSVAASELAEPLEANASAANLNFAYGDISFTPYALENTEDTIWEVNPSRGIAALQFDVPEEHASAGHSTVEVSVEYLDVGEGAFTLLYHSDTPNVEIHSARPSNIYESGSTVSFELEFSENDRRQADVVALSNSGQWKTKVFTLTGASLENAINGYDFALLNHIPSRADLAPTNLSVRNIAVRGLEQNQALQNEVKLVYNIVDLSSGEHVLQGEQNVDVETMLANSIPISTTVDRNGLYELQVELVGHENTASSEPFSVMSIYDTSDTVNDIFGICTHYGLPWFNGDIGFKAEIGKLSGAGWVRDELRWQEAETERGIVEVLPQWDAYVNASLAAGQQPLLILGYGNSLYDGGSIPHTEEGLAAFGNYVRTMVSHFAGRVEHFEVWNEYNYLGSSFNPEARPPEDYVRLLEVAYTAAKEANPNVTIVGGAMAGADVPWLNSILREGAGDYMDAISYHPYTHPNSPEGGGFFQAAIALPQIMRQHNVSLPLWVTEVGWPVTQDASSASELDAANFLVRTYVLGIVADLDKIFWYDLINDGSDQNETEHNFGLVRSWYDEEMPLAAKFPYLAYNTVAGQLADAEYVNFRGLSSNKFVAFFEKPGSNTTLMVAWTLQGEESVSFNTQGNDAVIRDIFSNESEVAAQNGQITVTLSPSPVFIEYEQTGT